MQIVKININQIKPYWRNPRNNEKTIAQIKLSIQKYGYTQPILLDTKNIIIAGHARYKALLELGYTEVDCVISDMNEELAKEYRIVDNKIHETTEWDFKELKMEMKTLSKDTMELFFNDIEIEDIYSDDIGLNIKDITGEDMAKSKDELNNKFNVMSNDDQERKVEVMCPNCLEKFYLNKEDTKG